MKRRTGLMRDRRGVAAVEFAMLLGALITLCIGTIEVGLIFWGKSALQAAAVDTARCRALSTSTCPDDASAQAHAVNMVTQWMFSGVVTATDVTLNGNDPCYTNSGSTFEVVTIQTTYFADRLPNFVTQLTNRTLSVKACYPK